MDTSNPVKKDDHLLDDLESIRQLLGDDNLQPPLLTETADGDEQLREIRMLAEQFGELIDHDEQGRQRWQVGARRACPPVVADSGQVPGRPQQSLAPCQLAGEGVAVVVDDVDAAQEGLHRQAARVLGGAAVLAATPALPGCSSALPAEALAAWQPPAPVPPGGDVRRWLLAHAILAPHSHNLQSWLVDLQTPGEIWLYCDHTRLLPETDPHSRQILMSQGTFLELLHLAALQQGLRAEMELFPHGVFDPRTPPAPEKSSSLPLRSSIRRMRTPLFKKLSSRRRLARIS